MSAQATRIDPLPSWNDTAAKAKTIDFVRNVTDLEGPGYFEPRESVATFDNDGPLWIERPLYAELAFAIHRVEVLANGKNSPIHVLTDDRERETHGFQVISRVDEGAGSGGRQSIRVRRA